MSDEISAVSMFSLRVGMIRNGKAIGSGTGFVYRAPNLERDFLVTNYHVLTAREPTNPAMLLPNYPDSPDAIELDFISSDGEIVHLAAPLADDCGTPEWIEHRQRAKGVDIAAIPITVGNDLRVYTQEQLGLVDDIRLHVGADLFIVGFPFGLATGDKFPNWKRGTVASEPLVEVNGLARFFVDSSTHPGMSGSPVFAMERREAFQVKAQTKKLLDEARIGRGSALDAVLSLSGEELKHQTTLRCLQLVGIYSGRLTGPRERDPTIGIVWKKKLIDEMFSDPVVAEHPFPPHRVE